MVNSAIFTIVFVCIIAIIVGTVNSKKDNTETASVEKAETMQEQEENNPKALTTVTARTPNTDNFHYETSLDGYQVPVPNGYVGSSVDDERYVNGINGTWKLQENLTLASPEGETYPWTLNSSTGVWSSGNYNVSNSTSTIETNSFTVSENAVVRINWSVCCETGKNFDYVYYTMTNTGTGVSIGGTGTQEARINGICYGTLDTSLIYVNKDVKLEAGTYKVTVTYSKNGSTNTNLDKAYVKSIGVYTKSAEGTEITVRERTGGVVIYEGTEAVTNDNVATAKTTRNQYVWVPISSDEVSNMYHMMSGVLYANQYNFAASGYSKVTSVSYEPQVINRYHDIDNGNLKQYLEGINRNEFLQEMREEFYEMLTSVKTYGGFYIGRYEIGNLSKNNVKVVKGQTGTTSSSNTSSNNINWINWYQAYKKCRNLRGTNPVYTGLIWGIQWDETLKWIIDSGERNNVEVGSKSTEWGNYRDSIVSGAGSLRSTGYSESWKANNIYDLAGNVSEWTMETDSTLYRYYRGGSCGNTGESSFLHYRNGDNPTYLGYGRPVGGPRFSLCIVEKFAS